MDVAKHVAEIRDRGYTVIEGALSADEIATTKAELAPYLGKRHMGRNDFEGFCTERVYALLAKAPSIAGIVEHPETLAIVDALLPDNYLLSANLAINVHPGETPQRFHRDDSGGAFLPMPRPMVGVSTIWAYDDFTADNGATEVIPGSHLWDQERLPDASEAVKVTMPAGSVIVFAGNLFHRGGANRSRTTRLAITPQYCWPMLRQLENMTLAVPPEAARQYSDRVQALLGYSINDPGFMGYVDGLHPKRLIDPDYVGRKYRDDLPPP
jgi:ectoine hydroxylase-related dioxygenase (phytanoyl-CoA dioxygenase family)